MSAARQCPLGSVESDDDLSESSLSSASSDSPPSYSNELKAPVRAAPPPPPPRRPSDGGRVPAGFESLCMDGNHFAELEKEINGLNAGGHASSSSEDEIGADEKDKFSAMVQPVDRRKLRRKHRQYHAKRIIAESESDSCTDDEERQPRNTNKKAAPLVELDDI
ncbi:hypothetical protein AAVH_01083 [Aphelenchoides avenae]|nr:hypothetical protein AAVH_01083 [Aphelenchus avenae]